MIPSVNPEAGGPIEGARQIDTRLVSLGVSVDLLTLDSPNESHVNCDYPGSVIPLGPSKFHYGYNGRIVNWLKQHHNQYDAVIVNGLWQYHCFAVWRALSKSATPYYVFTHGMLDPWFKRTYPLKHIKKWLYWPWADYRVLRDAKSVLFTSDEEKRVSRDSFFLYKCNEEVIAYGTSEPPQNDGFDLEFLSKYPHLVGKRIVLFLSRIHKKKGCDLLIEAFASIADSDPDAHLVIAGPDEEGLKSDLIDLAAKFDINDRITWPGMLSGKEKWGAFYASEVLCLPSHQENFGIVVAEALACGKPVLITNKVNIWREIVHDNAGFVENDNVEGVTLLLKRWLSLSSEDRRTMSFNAKNSFSHRFNVKNVAASLISLIQG